MKIAICYYGLAHNLDDVQNSNACNLPVNFRSAYELHKNNLWIPNEMDVFIHSWSYKKEKDINDLYKPIKSIFEPQIDFTNIANNINNDPSLFGHYQRAHIMSRWYSTKKSIELKSEYEKEKNFKYDLVMVTRFDCKYTGNWDLKSLNPSLFYITGGWGANYSKEYPDLWFISNSNYIDKLSSLYDNMKHVFYENRFDDVSNYWGGHLLARRHIAREGLLNKVNHYKIHTIDSDIIRG